uniref:Neuronal acetylcholine receptor subunit alpha-4-like n=1 Tax=Saccoglossus kowalevskii TaxID=10224 RepID=A0ABM0GVS4_SACKO|nr:PREDICTED: neuronal acetylcholine receptor subunit alpha-4-like [Saccoglossus kowalevskii]
MASPMLYGLELDVRGFEVEQQLQTDLFVNYSRYARPAEHNEPVVLTLGLVIMLLLDVVEKQQILKTSCWLNQYWQDKRLQWDPSDYGNLSTVIVPTSWIWNPGVVIQNSAGNDFYISETERLGIESDGSITYTPPAIFETPCRMNLDFFPFDVQKCELVFGPWDYTVDQLLLTQESDRIFNALLAPNSEWDIINSSVSLYEEFSENGELSWHIMTFTLELHRKPLYYVINIVIPSIMMALLTLLLFFLPADSGEKMSFSVSILIAMSVFTLLVGEMLPHSSDSVPLIGRYLLFNTCLVALSIAIAIFVLRLHHRPQHMLKMSPFVQKLFLTYLPKIMCLKPLERTGCAPSIHPNVQNHHGNRKSQMIIENVEESLQKYDKQPKEVSRSDDNSMMQILDKLYDDVHYLRNSMEVEESKKEMLEKWRYVAMVTDWLFFWISLLIYCIGTLVMFGNPDAYQ